MMLEEEIDVVKRFVYDLVCELTEKKLVDGDWKDTCEVMFDRDTRKGLERAMKDVGWYPDYFWQCRKRGHEEKVKE